MNLKDLFERAVETIGSIGGTPPTPLYTTAHVDQRPRYDLIDPDGRNQHFHVYDFETMMDHAVDPERFPLTPDWHLCRKHFAAQEHLMGAFQVAHCNDARYEVQVDNDCHHGCDTCRDEMHAYSRLASEALQETPYPG